MSDRSRRKTQERSSGPAFSGFGSSGQRPGGRGHMGFGGRGIQMQGEKPRDFKGTLKKFIQYIGKFKAQVLVVMISSQDQKSPRTTYS